MHKNPPIRGIDSRGRPWQTYCCSYYHDGSWWCLNITAYDWADAEARAKKLSLRLDGGPLYMTIPANIPASSLFVRSFCWIKNAWAKFKMTHYLIDWHPSGLAPTYKCPKCNGIGKKK